MILVADSKPETPITVELAEPGEDRELKAISYVRSILDCLSTEAQYRVLNYCSERLPPHGVEKMSG